MRKITKENIVETTIEVELYLKNDKPHIYLSNNGSSGCSYEVNNTDQIGELVAFYVQDLVEYGKK